QRPVFEHLLRPIMIVQLFAVCQRISIIVIEKQNRGFGNGAGKRPVELFAFFQFLLGLSSLGDVENNALPAYKLTVIALDKTASVVNPENIPVFADNAIFEIDAFTASHRIACFGQYLVAVVRV